MHLGVFHCFWAPPGSGLKFTCPCTEAAAVLDTRPFDKTHPFLAMARHGVAGDVWLVHVEPGRKIPLDGLPPQR